MWEFKTKVAIEALKDHKTINKLATEIDQAPIFHSIRDFHLKCVNGLNRVSYAT